MAASEMLFMEALPASGVISLSRFWGSPREQGSHSSLRTLATALRMAHSRSRAFMRVCKLHLALFRPIRSTRCRLRLPSVLLRSPSSSPVLSCAALGYCSKGLQLRNSVRRHHFLALLSFAELF